MSQFTSLLHCENQRRERLNTNERISVNISVTSSKRLCTVISASELDRTALLRTCRIPLFNYHRGKIICNVSINIGSLSIFNSESFVRQLALSRKSVSQTFKPDGVDPHLRRGVLQGKILYCMEKKTLRADFFIEPQVTSDLPGNDVDTQEHTNPSQLIFCVSLNWQMSSPLERDTCRISHSGYVVFHTGLIIFGWCEFGSGQSLIKHKAE